jgi:ABC-type multidrug transport system ATPase subunit
MSVPVLELQNVRKVFRSDLLRAKQVAVDGISCTFTAGRCTGLLGHNGAGKTTTLRLILGILSPDRGAVLFEGKPLGVNERRHVGYMPEVNRLPQALTPEELLDHQLQLFAPPAVEGRAARRAAVAAMLAATGLAEHRRRRIGHLSKGMARRLAWASATIHRPRLLVLDEPSSGLDPVGRRQMLAWIEAEKGRGTSIVLCTHELLQVAALCDDFHVLRRGKLVLTSDKAAKAPHGEWAQRYNIHVSGLSPEALERFGDERGLPPPAGVRRSGFLAVIGLAQYQDAARWLAALIAGGYVVTRFGDETFLGEDELLRHLEGDP